MKNIDEMLRRLEALEAEQDEIIENINEVIFDHMAVPKVSQFDYDDLITYKERLDEATGTDHKFSDILPIIADIYNDGYCRALHADEANTF